LQHVRNDVRFTRNYCPRAQKLKRCGGGPGRDASSRSDRQAGGSAQVARTILTVARSGETIGARWGEINIPEKVWIIPAERMKAGKEHRVPLSNRALGILEALKAEGPVNDDFVFSGGRRGKPLSNMAMAMALRRMKRGDLTVHGFRSTFRDWAAERTNFPAEIAEMTLAHAVGNKVEAAYRRGDLFERRRRIMADWAKFCGMPKTPDKQKILAFRKSG
jgi:integrase